MLQKCPYNRFEKNLIVILHQSWPMIFFPQFFRQKYFFRILHMVYNFSGGANLTQKSESKSLLLPMRSYYGHPYHFLTKISIFD